MKKKLKKLNFHQHVNLKPNNKVKSFYYQQSSFDFIQLTQKWEKIVGEKLVPHTYPKSLKNGVLTILVRHSVFAAQLKSLSPILIKKTISHFPSMASELKKINFITSEIFFAQRNEKIKQDQKVEPEENIYNPHYAQAKHDANKEFSDIKEEDLKELFVSLYVQTNHNK